MTIVAVLKQESEQILIMYLTEGTGSTFELMMGL